MSTRTDTPELVVLDFGGQYAHLIARTIRDLGVFCRIERPGDFKPGPSLSGLILSGGPGSVTQGILPELGFDPLNLAVPVLGICFGHQLLAAAAGGRVVPGRACEYGPAQIRLAQPLSALFQGLGPELRVWMSHGDHVQELPAGMRVTASSPDVEIAAFEAENKPIFGLQFHPEVYHTERGRDILSRFVERCVGSTRAWDPGASERLALARVLESVGERKVFILVSGGVDSLVTLLACLRALGPERVRGLHVDTGLMRHQESDQVMAFLQDLCPGVVERVNAAPRFLGALERVTEPEEKRAIIGRLFLREVESRMPQGAGWVLAQGTIYPDTIESGGSGGPHGAATIKTHHNRVDEIRRWILEGRVVEPLADLYKHEVRALGHRLGLPDALVERQPFPGPGLAVRVLCAGPESGESVHREPALEALFGESGWECRVLPVRSVGVQGDSRTFRHPVAIWRPERPESWEQLFALAGRAANSVPSINRVVLHLGGCPIPELRGLPTGLGSQELALLRQADHLATQAVQSETEIWQMPVVLLPLADPSGRRAIVLRPVRSRDAMTADPYPMPLPLLERLTSVLLGIEGLGSVLYDCTSKPPGTIEWE